MTKLCKECGGWKNQPVGTQGYINCYCAPSGQIRIRSVQGGFKIDEIVTTYGHWITWPELFADEETAKHYLKELGYAIN